MTRSEHQPSRADRLRVVAWPIIATLVVAIFALLRMWQLAIPVPEGTMCAAIEPAPPGCAGDARILPAAIWSGIVIFVTALTVGLALSGRVARQAIWGGVAVTGVLALFGLRDVEHLPGL